MDICAGSIPAENWILGDGKVPDHSTLARFRTGRCRDALEGLFYQLVGKLEAMGETDHQTVFVDGTKLESRAGRYTFVWRKSAEKQLAKVKEQVRQQTGLTGLAALASYLEEAVQGHPVRSRQREAEKPGAERLGKTAWAAGTVAGI